MSDATKSNGAKGEHAPAPSASLGMTQENQGTWDRCVRGPLLLLLPVLHCCYLLWRVGSHQKICWEIVFFLSFWARQGLFWPYYTCFSVGAVS